MVRCDLYFSLLLFYLITSSWFLLITLPLQRCWLSHVLPFDICWWWDQATSSHCIVYQATVFLQYITTLNYDVWSPSFVSQDILCPPVSLYTCGQVDWSSGIILGDYCLLSSLTPPPPSIHLPCDSVGVVPHCIPQHPSRFDSLIVVVRSRT